MVEKNFILHNRISTLEVRN